MRISGAWNGSVSLSAPLRPAAHCAAPMYDREAGSLSRPDIHDAWGELVNMAGGHVKALVPSVARLSLPSVAESSAFAYRQTGSSALDELTFACMGNRFKVTVLQQG